MAEAGTMAGDGNDTPPGEDEQTAARIRRAKRYLENHLDNQRRWYSERASKYKKWSQYLAFTVLAAGGLITFMQVFRPEEAWYRWPTIATCLLGLVVVLAKGLERIGNFEETWSTYRKASERMKREYRLYINGAGDYRTAEGEEEAYLQFVDTIEQIIAEEQQLYWQSRSGERDNGGHAHGEEGTGTASRRSTGARSR
jgi:hypothetical protein